MKKTLLFAAAAMMSAASLAQDISITKAQDDNFDPTFKFSADNSYAYIYVGDETKVASGIAEENFIYIGPEGENGSLQVWPDGTSFSFPTPTGNNSFDIPGEFMSVRVGSLGWSGLGYNLFDSKPLNLSFIDSNWTFHFAIKMTSEATVDFYLTDGKGNKADIVLGKTPYDSAPAVGDFSRDGDWYNIDVPMSYLEDQFEFTFDGDTKYTGNLLCILGGGIEGTVIDYDAVFFYGPKVDADAANGIAGVKQATAAKEIYNLAGQRIDSMQRGINIVRTAQGVKKVLNF